MDGLQRSRLNHLAMKTLCESSAIPFTFPLEVLKQVEQDGQFHVVGYAATTDFDLQGDIITEEALQNASLDLLKNSTVLLNHDLTQSIGKVTKVDFDRHGLLIDALISQTEPEIIQKIKEGVLNKFSIRGQVLEREKKFMREYDRMVNVIKKIALVEVSLVSVPANPEARAIGWYLSKALEGGEKTMSDDQVVVEEISPDAPVPAKGPEEETAPAIPDPAPGEPEPAVPPDPAPAAAEAQKALSGPVRMMMAPAFFLLDKLIATGGEAAATAQQIKAILSAMSESSSALSPATPAPTSKAMSPEDIAKMVSGEVKKQIESALKTIPTVRKGLVSQDPEPDDVKKTYESLSPEKKLRVALALQQA